ncbi:MAG: hypothetical protein U1F09_05150 [Steroidobacteraceae bacterium]
MRRARRLAPHPFRVAIAPAVILASGCTSLSGRQAPPDIPPPPLQLVSAGNLELPRDCDVRDGVVYRTNFVVGLDGRVADIRPDPAPACLQRALAAWLGTAQYVPPGDAVATVIDWMSVSARREH